MLVYRDQKRELPVRERIRALEALATGPVTLDTAVELLIELGELETGIADLLEPDADSNGPVLSSLRQVSLTSGRLLYRIWRGKDSQAELAGLLRRQLAEIGRLQVPETARVSISEGYAYYGLYPQMYLESAERFLEDKKLPRAVIIGLRNIGSSLSAIVAGTLSELGVQVALYTVRPHGHPFDRRVTLAPSLAQEWQSQQDSHFLIADEGPGISGSSLTSAAEALSQLGIPDERIVYMPSWEPAKNDLVSVRARESWGKHEKITTSFEQLWTDSGRLALSLATGQLSVMSAGKWRQVLLPDSATWPPVQPQHERIKLLFRPADERNHPLLLKFAGLGYYGNAIQKRAETLAEAGFAPRVASLRNGILATEFKQATILARPKVTRALLDRVADYLGFVSKQFPAQPHTSFDTLAEMIEVNTREGLGEEWTERLGLKDYREPVSSASSVALDARMFPHEWLETDAGWIKTDGLEHHDDHFYPGPQNGAWDLAATAFEFGLDQAAQSYLLERYIAITGDSQVHDRLGFYRLAYLAFRLGYATMATASLGVTEDAHRFADAKYRYARLLNREIASREH